nr:shufflon system plasmid conjugative transfer pilus tip adhesin PilV [Erwinia sp. Ejp617]
MKAGFMRIDRGDTLFSLSLVLAITLIAAPVAYQRYADYMQLKEWDVTASQMNTLSFSAKRFIKDHYNELQDQLLGRSSLVIDCGELAQQGYLPSGFSLKNNQGQTYQLVMSTARNEHSGMTSMLITLGGSAIAYKGLRYIARSMEGAGGYIYSPGMAKGADGAWDMDLQALGVTAESGHLVNYLSAVMPGTVKADSDRLYRYRVEGRSDLNQMHTSVDMNGNGINNISQLNASTGNFQGNIGGKRIVAHQALWSDGNIMAEGDIRSTGGWILTRQANGWMNEDHQGGFYMDDDRWVKSYKGKGIYTSGELKAGTINAEGRLTANEYLKIKGHGIIDNSCEDNGLLANGDNDTLLICQQGRWQSTGKSSGAYQQTGLFNGSYNGLNSTNRTQWIMASGGNAVSTARAGMGECRNSSSIIASINGVQIANNSNDNVETPSSSFISFPAPPKSRYSVTSFPAKKYGCGSGIFRLSIYD